MESLQAKCEYGAVLVLFNEEVANIATLLKSNLRNQQGMAEKVKAYIKTREPSIRCKTGPRKGRVSGT